MFVSVSWWLLPSSCKQHPTAQVGLCDKMIGNADVIPGLVFWVHVSLSRVGILPPWPHWQFMARRGIVQQSWRRFPEIQVGVQAWSSAMCRHTSHMVLPVIYPFIIVTSEKLIIQNLCEIYRMSTFFSIYRGLLSASNMSAPHIMETKSTNNIKFTSWLLTKAHRNKMHYVNRQWEKLVCDFGKRHCIPGSLQI